MRQPFSESQNVQLTQSQQARSNEKTFKNLNFAYFFSVFIGVYAFYSTMTHDSVDYNVFFVFDSLGVVIVSS